MKIKPRRWLKYKYLSFIRIKDNPRNIAVGAALGVAFDVLPTFGLGVVIAYFISALIKVNRLAAVISAVVGKIAIPFFVYINIKTGQFFYQGPSGLELEPQTVNVLDWTKLGKSFLIGSFVNSILVYGFTYVVIYFFVSWRRIRVLRVKNPV